MTGICSGTSAGRSSTTIVELEEELEDGWEEVGGGGKAEEIDSSPASSRSSMLRREMQSESEWVWELNSEEGELGWEMLIVWIGVGGKGVEGEGCGGREMGR